MGELIKWIKTWAIIALGVLIASATSSGIQYENSLSLFLAVVLISVLNMVVRPIMILFTLPFIIMTCGLGIFIINALLFMFVAAMVPGFIVTSFWAALWGAFIVGGTSLIANMMLGSTRVQVQGRDVGPGQSPSSRNNEKLKDDDVIDL